MKPLKFIFAQDEDGVIGHGLTLPDWSVTDDFKKNFVPKTAGCPFICGSKTALSLKNIPLKGRIKIAISRDPSFSVEGFEVFNDPWLALAFAEKCAGHTTWIIGGADTFKLYSSIAVIHEIHITTIEARYPAENAVVFKGYDSNLYEIDLTQSMYFEKRLPGENDRGNKENARVEVYKYNPAA